MIRNYLPGIVIGLLLGGTASAQTVEELVARGGELFHADIGCHVCHGPNAQGLVGPTLHFGPTPVDIFDQLESNPMMGVIVAEMDPSDADLEAIAMYIRTLADLPPDLGLVEGWRTALATVKANQAQQLEFMKTPRDLQVEAIETFASVQETWTRRAREGNLTSHYQTEVIATFDPGEPKFTPEPGKTYFYENVGTTSSPSVLYDGYVPPPSNQIVVGDAETKEIIASYMLPESLRATVHGTVMSPDGRYVYIIGARPGQADNEPTVNSSATLIKADALTLQPIKQFTIGGRIHHAQAFRDLVLVDMFARDPDGLGVFLLDPETDEVVGGIRDVDLGGFAYTAWSDKDYEYIYALVEPAGYAPGRATGMFAAVSMYQGRFTALRPFWIAKIDPDTWEVLREYPIPGYRPNWLVVDSAKENMYVINSLSNAAKINIETGEVVWTNGTGIGPYGASLNIDETELWVADKGEGAHHLGRTVTIIDTQTGHATETLYGAYKVDHVLLDPTGTEMWATSNGEGRIYVYDAESRELTNIIDMPGNGDAHGLVWVHYDDNGEPRVVRDQGNFHGGVNPVLGNALNF